MLVRQSQAVMMIGSQQRRKSRLRMIHLELFNTWLSASEAEDAKDGCILEWKSL